MEDFPKLFTRKGRVKDYETKIKTRDAAKWAATTDPTAKSNRSRK